MILYLALIGDGSGSSVGVIEKIEAQVESFKKRTNIICVTFSTAKKLENITSQIINESIYSKNRIFQRIKMFRLFDIYTKLYPDAHVLIRYPLSDLLFLIYLMKNKNRKIYVERQTIETTEIISDNRLISYLKVLLDIIFYNFTKHYIKHEIAVTNEIARHLSKYRNKNTISIIPNGVRSINISDDINKQSKDYIDICYIGNIANWSGLDILIKAFEDIGFKIDNKNIILNIIGEGVKLEKLKDLAIHSKFNKNIKFWGKLEGSNKYKILFNMDIGVSSLNPWKRGLKEGSNLKNREYCLLGIPFIKADYDSEFDNILDCKRFFRNVRNKNDIIFSIKELLKDVETYPEIRKHMQAYASTKLSWDSKIDEYLNIFQS